MNAFFQYGIKVYPHQQQWAVQHPGNVGSKETFGDTLHPTKKDAQLEACLLAGVSLRDIKESLTPFTPWLGGPLNQKASAYERRAKLLNKQVRYNEGVMTQKAFIEKKVKEGATLNVREEPKIKDMSRMRHFRADGETQREHERKQKAAGNKKTYSIGWNSKDGYGVFIDITKTEYDYGIYLQEELSAPSTITPKLSLTRLYGLWGKLRDVPTHEDSEGIRVIDEGFMTFFAGDSVEDVWAWFEAQNPRFVVGEVLAGNYHRRQEIAYPLQSATA